MKLRPLNDAIIIEPDNNQILDSNPEIVRIAKEGLIQLPDSHSLEKSANTGTIISWGDKCKYKDLYKIGCKVMFKLFGGFTFYYDGKKLKSLIEDELIAIYET